MLHQLHEDYFQLQRIAPFDLYLKPGIKHFPDYHPALDLLIKRVRLDAPFLDATGTAGVYAALSGLEEGVVQETSANALAVARRNLEAKAYAYLAAALWQGPPGRFKTVVATLSGDKGNARVEAEIEGIYQALCADGTAYTLGHKDQGAKRYESYLERYFDKVKIIAKDKGWRLVQVSGKREQEAKVNRLAFEVLGLKLEAEPGVYAAGKLDPGTAFMVSTYDFSQLASKRVLDLGCGYGLLAIKAALSGAEVTAIDDDLLAVHSTYHNAKTFGLDIRCLHSDVDVELKSNEHFDVVLSNPPFHVAKQVRLELPHAFIAAAFKHLKIGGEFVFVANKALDYEPLLAEFSYWEMLASNHAFKVLRAIR